MALSKLVANSFDLTDNYALTGTVTGVVSTQKIFLIKNIDASSSSTVDFKDGTSSVVLDNTYKTYLFRFKGIHPATDGAEFEFQGNAAGGSGFNETVTTSYFEADHAEDDSEASLSYITGEDHAQSTSYQTLTRNVSSDNDHALGGELYLFNPSNTTFVTHFISRVAQTNINNKVHDTFVSGYFNTTAAIDEISFKFSSGNIDSGRIALYGIK